MIERQHKKLSIRRQSRLLGINRNRLHPRVTKTSQEDEDIMRHLDELHTRWPFLGQRKLIEELKDRGVQIGRKRLRRLMKVMGIEAIAPKPPLSQPAPGHKVYPYLLRHRKITEVDEVWCTDITYIPMPTGHAYLIAIMDWHSRAVLAWELSNTADTAMCMRALQRALSSGRRPKIFNTDQGSQFTSKDWVQAIESHGIEVSMDGKGRWIDNRMIERLWRSLKYECVYLHAFERGSEAKAGIGRWLTYYNSERPHSTHGILTPDEAYDSKTEPTRLAA